MKLLLIGFLLLIFGYAGYHAYRINDLRLVGRELVARAIPYEQSPANPTRRVLIIGDSLQAGVGASAPQNSMAGLLGAEFPDWEIINLAESGDETAEALDKVQNFEGEGFDLAIVQIGANDIFHRVDLDVSKENLQEILAIATEKADRVLYVTSGSVGYAPLFPAPLDYYFTHRSREAIPAFIQVTQDLDIPSLNNYRDRDEDVFEQDPDTYYAADKFHLSDAGYAVWHERLIEKLSTIGFTN